MKTPTTINPAIPAITLLMDIPEGTYCQRATGVDPRAGGPVYLRGAENGKGMLLLTPVDGGKPFLTARAGRGAAIPPCTITIDHLGSETKIVINEADKSWEQCGYRFQLVQSESHEDFNTYNITMDGTPSDMGVSEDLPSRRAWADAYGCERSGINIYEAAVRLIAAVV